MMFSVKLYENDKVIIDGSFSGTLEQNFISYNDGVNNILDLNKLILERIGDDYKIVFDFSNSSCIYVMNELSVNMAINIMESKKCSNGLFFKYEIVDTGNVYEYSIRW